MAQMSESDAQARVREMQEQMVAGGVDIASLEAAEGAEGSAVEGKSGLGWGGWWWVWHNWRLTQQVRPRPIAHESNIGRALALFRCPEFLQASFSPSFFL